MTMMIVMGYPLLKASEEDHTVGNIEMPIGAVPLQVLPNEAGDPVMLAVAPVNALRALHPVRLVHPGQPFMMPLGKTIGRLLGSIPIVGSGGGGYVIVLQELPWPTKDETLNSAVGAGEAAN